MNINVNSYHLLNNKKHKNNHNVNFNFITNHNDNNNNKIINIPDSINKNNKQ